MELSTTVISAYYSALMSAQHLTNSSREFVSVCMTQLASMHAGVESLITSSATSCIDDKALEDVIREYQLEQDDVEASESGDS
ncbi:hypothetical protein AZE42_13056 [Rhizopogon vesiculosus]|uniref:Uncharacterized protein n=1 Tax=Rhizopogon vesiculosus TaxID=180088 RepID=A0A1J8PJ59_9AGAM|nr:hypothetical protein AZE42_13056 [Rhizopogon vesiculosus]